VVQTSSGSVLSTHNKVPVVIDKFSYPLAINYSNLDSTGRSCTYEVSTLCLQSAHLLPLGHTTFDLSYNRELLPLPIVVKSTIEERQTAGQDTLLNFMYDDTNSFDRWVFLPSDWRKQGQWIDQQYFQLF